MTTPKVQQFQRTLHRLSPKEIVKDVTFLGKEEQLPFMGSEESGLSVVIRLV